MNPEPELEAPDNAPDKEEPDDFVPGAWLLPEMLRLFAPPVAPLDAPEPTIDEPTT